MKLFKNKVGRPSKKVKRQRIIFYIIIVLVITITSMMLGILLDKMVISDINNVNTYSLKAETRNSGIFEMIKKISDTLMKSIKKRKIPATKKITTKVVTKKTTELTISTTRNVTTPVKTTTLVNKNELEKRSYNTSVCSFPYSRKYCVNTNDSIAKSNVKKIQSMLNELGYNLKIDGLYGEETEKAVIDYQNKNDISPADGVVGYNELKSLSINTKTRYFDIQYYKDSAVDSYSNELKGTSKITNKSNKKTRTMQTVIYGVSQKISSEVLKKDNYTHVGYIATTYYDIDKDGKLESEEKYRYGCYDIKCENDDDAGWELQSKIDANKKKGKIFKSYIYSIGEKVSKTGFKYSGQKVNFTAHYCKGTNKVYDKNKSKCKDKGVKATTKSGSWDGTVLTASRGTIIGPSGKETWYDLKMDEVIDMMRAKGYSESKYPYWIREDGVKMFGDYVMVAADLKIRPKGTILETSLGTGMVCDTGTFTKTNKTQLDIAVDWKDGNGI